MSIDYDITFSGKEFMLRALLPFFFVGVGSMAGGMSRYGLTLITQNASAFAIPFGTLITNITGCLIIGLIAGISGKTELLSTEMRLLLATGFCGGFTTMSSFIYELGQYIQDKEFFFASSYFVATLAGAGLAFVIGLLISEFLLA
jgi:CrcB protein